MTQLLRQADSTSVISIGRETTCGADFDFERVEPDTLQHSQMRMLRLLYKIKIQKRGWEEIQCESYLRRFNSTRGKRLQRIKEEQGWSPGRLSLWEIGGK